MRAEQASKLLALVAEDGWDTLLEEGVPEVQDVDADVVFQQLLAEWREGKDMIDEYLRWQEELADG